MAEENKNSNIDNVDKQPESNTNQATSSQNTNVEAKVEEAKGLVKSEKGKKIIGIILAVILALGYIGMKACSKSGSINHRLQQMEKHVPGSKSEKPELTREILEKTAIPTIKKEGHRNNLTQAKMTGVYFESVELGEGVSLVLSYKLTNKEAQGEDAEMDNDAIILKTFCKSQIKLIDALDYIEVVYKRKDLSVISDVKVTKEACQELKKAKK